MFRRHTLFWCALEQLPLIPRVCLAPGELTAGFFDAMDPAALPHDSKGHIVILAGAITNSLATIAVCARLYTRRIITHQAGIDDWIAAVSLVCSGYENYLALLYIGNVTNIF